jgi:hypothetical protein
LCAFFSRILAKNATSVGHRWLAKSQTIKNAAHWQHFFYLRRRSYLNTKSTREPLKNYLARPGGVEIPKKMLIYCV